MSVSSISLSSDANVRYQRLSQEYTKLRAQAKVLREGVLEERGKVEKLTEELKSKEAVIRRLQAENESLTFRNDQLVRRVENFQFEPTRKSTSSKSQLTNHADSAKIELLEQELQSKLQQNERLVSELAENERQHAIEMAEMSEKLAKEMRKLEDEVKGMQLKTKATSQKGSVENIELERLEEVKEDAELMIGSPEPPESQEEAMIMVAEAVRSSFSALNNVFNLFKQRCEIYPYDVTMERLPPHVEKLSSEYAQTARLFSTLVEISDTIIMNSLYEPHHHLPPITSKCRLISQHCNQMLIELIRQMTGEENRVTWCTAPLCKLNNQWESLLLKLFEAFENVTKSLEVFSAPNNSKTSESTDNFLSALDELDYVTTGLLECFQKRWVFESRLPTTTRRMRCVGLTLEAALHMVSQETSKLAARARSVHNIALKKERKKIIAVKKTTEKGKREVKQLKAEKESQIPSYELTELSEKEKLVEKEYNPFFDEENYLKYASENAESIDSTSLKQDDNVSIIISSKINQIQPSLSVSHNHLQSEFRLLQNRNEELQKERDRLFVDNSLVKRKLEIATAAAQPEVKIERKSSSDLDQVWSIGMERRDDWINRVHKAEKAIRFYETEFDLLLRHELSSEEHLKQVICELDAVSKQKHRLEDELESVRRSYESQLGDLSEHLATVIKDREKEKETNKNRGSLKNFFNKS